MMINNNSVSERAILIGFGHQSPEAIDNSLDELARLLETAGGTEAGRVTQRGKPHPAHFVGTGKLEEIASLADDTGAECIIFDDELSPSQLSNLEKHLNRKVLDRAMLILSIFARHAHTKEAKTQVELAQYEYLYPRLTGQWTHLTRHWGGIGTRGPGETQLETDRRLVSRRIQKLKERLKSIDKERAVQRRGRRDMFRVVMVGYTNAGKSTLFNRLTRSKVWAADRLFCTLDPTSRVLAEKNGRQIVLTDTIGFIRKLPASVFAAFRATLNEVASADLLLVVIDAVDPVRSESIAEVERSLAAIGADQIPQLLVLNKIDLLKGQPVEPLGIDLSETETLAVSATEQIGLKRLSGAIFDRAMRIGLPTRRRHARTARARVHFEHNPPR